MPWVVWGTTTLYTVAGNVQILFHNFFGKEIDVHVDYYYIILGVLHRTVLLLVLNVCFESSSVRITLNIRRLGGQELKQMNHAITNAILTQ